MTRSLQQDSDLGEIIEVLRATRGWSQSQLALASGIAQSSISEYELRKKIPHLSNLERLVGSMGYRLSAIEATRGYLAHLRHNHAVAAEEDRREAPGLLARLLRHGQPVRLALVLEAREFQSWALAELLSEESWRAARSDAARAVELAEVAVAIADAISDTSPLLFRLRGFTRGHLANARRVAGDLAAAAEIFEAADRLWNAGRADRTRLLEEARMPAMKAALRREDRHLEEARALFDEALAIDKGPLRPTFLVGKATVLEELGDLAGAIALLEEARALTNPRKDPPLFYSIRHNLTVFFANAGRYTEAEALLPEVRRLAGQGGLALDCLRLQWVEGKIAAGRGKVTQAIEILTKVRGGFQSQRIWYDAALVSLELSTLYLRAGRTAEVKTIARHLVPIFKGEGVHREALAALLVFRQAAEKDAVTLDLIDRVHGFLIAIRRNPKLTWTSD